MSNNRIVAVQSRYFRIDASSTPLKEEALTSLADGVAADLCRQLGLTLEPWVPVSVDVGAGPSQAIGRQIRIEAKPAAGRHTAEDWFELLLRHELTHVLVAENWGIAPCLFWEGLPIHLGDNHVRRRLFGHSYHDHCAALSRCRALLPLRRLILPSDYYSRRSDFRVDLQAGAFTGFLLERDGIAGLRSLFRSYRPPTPDRPWVAVDRLFQKHLGADLAGLESAWRAALLASPADPGHVEKYRSRRFGETPTLPAHCDFCMHPLDRTGRRCTGCKQPATTVELR